MSIRALAVLLVTLAFARPLAAQSIPFDVCAESTTWERPAVEVQAKIWNDPRYFVLPPNTPLGSRITRNDYVWTHNFIVMDDPLSASGEYHLRNLTGLWTEPPPFNNCA